MRPIGSDGDKTKARILEIATELFASEPGGKISMRRLARECGLSAPSVYYYFSSKSELLDACSERYVGDLRALYVHARDRLAAGTDLAHLANYVIARALYLTSRSRGILLSQPERPTGDKSSASVTIEQILDDGTALLADVTQTPVAALRILLVTMGLLVRAYALSESEELRSLLKVPEHLNELAYAEGHLTQVFVRTIEHSRSLLAPHPISH